MNVTDCPCRPGLGLIESINDSGGLLAGEAAGVGIEVCIANKTIATPVKTIPTAAIFFHLSGLGTGSGIGSDKLIHLRSSINFNFPLLILKPSLLASYPIIWFKNCWPMLNENDPSLSEFRFIVELPIEKLILALSRGLSVSSQIFPFILISISSIRISDLISNLSISCEISFLIKPSFWMT